MRNKLFEYWCSKIGCPLHFIACLICRYVKYEMFERFEIWYVYRSIDRPSVRPNERPTDGQLTEKCQNQIQIVLNQWILWRTLFNLRKCRFRNRKKTIKIIEHAYSSRFWTRWFSNGPLKHHWRCEFLY